MNAAFGLLVLALPFAASAGDVAATITTTGETRIDNEPAAGSDAPLPDYAILINRINLGAYDGDSSGQLRIDSTTFSERPAEQGRRPYKNDLRIERINVAQQLGSLRLTGGDFFRQLGRGLVLSLRKEDEIGVDVSLRGGLVEYGGDLHAASLFGGVTNPQNLDPVTQRFVHDTEDLMAGGAYELRAIDGVLLGVHGLYLQPRVGLLRGSRDVVTSGGAYAELLDLIPNVVIYAEGAAQLRQLAGVEQIGWGAYTTADAHVGSTSLLLELIQLDGFEQRGTPSSAVGNRFAYNRPPTLQRIQEEVLDNQDVTGGRLRVEHVIVFGDPLAAAGATGYAAEASLELWANALVRTTGAERNTLQLHGWGGGDLSLSGGTRLMLAGGYRDESQPAGPIKKMVHIEVEAAVPVGGDFILEARTDTELRTSYAPEQDGELAGHDYVRGSTFLGVERAGVGAVTFELGYDTGGTSIRDVSFAAIVGVNMSDTLQGTLTAGTQRGGLKCVNGVCRIFPAFAGVRLELIARL